MKKKLLPFIILNVFFLLAVVATDVLYLELGNPYTFKTLASMTFVLCAICNAILALALKIKLNKGFMIFMLFGQFLAMLGDIFLIEHFIIGAILFAVGHIFFFVAYCFIKRPSLNDVGLIAITIAISFAVIAVSGGKFEGQLPLVLAYALIISVMLAKSACVLAKNKAMGAILFSGSLMFYLSDLFLMFCVFAGGGIVFDYLCLGFYYPAEFVLAMSISAINLIAHNKEIKQINKK